MAKFAHWDPADPEHRVIGWYNTDRHRHHSFPMSNVIEITEEEWQMTRADPNGWAVDPTREGRLIPFTGGPALYDPPEPLKQQLAAQIQRYQQTE